MEKIPDWAALWRELVQLNTGWKESKGEKKDYWHSKARQFADDVKRRWLHPDSSRRLILSKVHLEASFLDIGAGTGAWSIFLAPHVRQVTAVERSPSMIQVMRENIAAQSTNNIQIVEGIWPGVPVEQHDFSLCSHGMYGSEDFPAFVRAMIAATRRTCFLLLRVPTPDNLLSEAARHILGQPYDSPNFNIAYNILLELGIPANVLMEDSGLWKPWTHDSLETALDETKRRLGAGSDECHDAYLRDLLSRRLRCEGGKYIWPPSVRSALLYWDV